MSQCMLCLAEGVPFKRYLHAGALVTLCSDVILCRSTVAARENKAHHIRTNVKPLPDAPPERDRRSASAGDD